MLATFQRLNQKISTERLSVRLPMIFRWEGRIIMRGSWARISRILLMLSLLRINLFRGSDVYKILWSWRGMWRMSWEEEVRPKVRLRRIFQRGLFRRLFLGIRVMFLMFILRMCLGRLISRLRLRLRGLLRVLGRRSLRYWKMS